MGRLEKIVPKEALQNLLIKEFGSEGRLALAFMEAEKPTGEIGGRCSSFFSE